MANLKMKFKLNSLEFEIDGEESTVKEQFSDFKTFVVGDLLPNMNNLESSKKEILEQENKNILLEGEIEKDNLEYPIFKEIVKRNLPSSESEWILIYAFYSSNFGKEIFSEESIKQKYQESGRYNGSKKNNFSNNLKTLLIGGLLKMYSENEYTFNPEGIEKVHKIINGESKKSGKKKDPLNSKKSKSKGSSDSPTYLNDLNLKVPGKESLIDFYNTYDIGSNQERNLVYIYYLKEILKIEEITLPHIYTCYRETSQRIPEKLYQSLIDTKNRKGWIDTENTENIKVTIRGENYMKNDIPKK